MKTIANFHQDNGRTVRKVFSRFIEVYRDMNFFVNGLVLIEVGKPKVSNGPDLIGYTQTKIKRRIQEIEPSIIDCSSQ